MTKLEELKEAMDKAIEEFNIVHEEFRKKNNAQIQAKQAYEKELWKDKTCDSCMYSIVLEDYGDHNKCGCEDAPCTCCNRYCEYYQPDTCITKALKEDAELNESKWCDFFLSPEEVEGLNKLGFDIYKPQYDTDGDTVVNIMKIKRDRCKIK